jgi:SAM-dependent MidA family methyltransferase
MTAIPLDLPEPDALAQQISAELTAQIKQQIIAAGGRISFAEFMHQALYAPGLGYYSAGKHKIGPQGDFITAPEISPLFSYALAEQCAQVFAHLDEPNILEFGAGKGTMAADILLHLECLKQLPTHYYILEVSADLRQRQEQTIAASCPHLQTRVVWLDSLPAEPLSAVVLANEVLDAFAVELFNICEAGIAQTYVEIQDDALQLTQSFDLSPQFESHVNHLQTELQLQTGYQSEVNLLMPPWWQALSACLHQGVVLIIDYGYPRREYYHPQRHAGTLQCFYQHRAHNDALTLVGLQDITTHVDFTAVAEGANAADFGVLGYCSQSMFLLSNRMLELADANELDRIDEFNQAQQIKKLTLPTEMGEKFKVMALGKNYSEPLQGFSLQNNLHYL